jgi:CheY-like chemotaxis protein
MSGGQRPERRVLLAEDNAVNQLVAARLLQKRGFVVDVAANGRIALELHERTPYVAIFMDCQMPELDGYAATREIRRREGDAHHTPIIAMTASTLDGDAERCLAAGMDYYSSKPVNPDDLDEVIAQALGSSRADGGTATSAAPTPSGRPPRGEILFDHRLLDDVCQGDERVRNGLTKTFLDQARTDIADLAHAITAGDSAAVAVAAHRLMGGAASVGALRIAAISDELCDAAHAGKLPETNALQLQLVRALDLTQTALGLAYLTTAPPR